MAKTYHGQEAVNKLEADLGRPLSLAERRVAEEEGYVDGEYKDDKGISTSGVGQTGKYRDMSFTETFDEHRKYAAESIQGFDNLPEELQAEFIQLAYRGDLQQSPTARKMFNEGNYEEASKELLNHKEYNERKKQGDDGVTRRLEAASEAIVNFPEPSADKSQVQSKGTIKDVVDGDTFTTGNDTLRVSGINTPESVHPDEDRNTEEGKVASDFAKDVMPVGSEVTVDSYGKGTFGRNLSGVTRNINGTEVDYGLVALDQQMSTYYTKYGEHPDPMKHDQYKEYYSRLVPYQLGTSEELPSKEEMEEITVLQQKFSKTYRDFKEGEATQEQLDSVTAELYGDPQKVMKYRRALVRGNFQMNSSNPNTLAGAMKIAMENQPELVGEYNRAVRNGHLQFSNAPEEEPSFWTKAGASFGMFSSVANVADTENLWSARRHGADAKIPETELVKGVPDQYHSLILQESEKYNDTAALVLRDQLQSDIENNKIFDNMEWYAQFGYGALSLVADPLTFAPAGMVAKGGQAIVNTNRAWQVARVIGGKEIVAGSAGGAKLTAYAAAGATEGAIINAPRLTGDHTYTARDYQLDIMMDTAFGVALGGAISAVPYTIEYSKQLRKSRQIEQSQIMQKAEQESEAKAKGVSESDVVGSVNPEMDVVKEEVQQKAQVPKAQAKVKRATGIKFPEWSAVGEVSSDGYNKAVKSLNNLFPKNSSMRKLLNVGIGLNKKADADAKDIVDKLNSDILHIAAAFPSGKVPKEIGKALEGVAFNQKSYTRKNAMATLLQGDTADQVGELTSYIETLRNREELWDGYDVQPLSGSEFFKHQGDILTREFGSQGDDIFELTNTLPKELSYLKDVVELNKVAVEKADPAFTELVEELNGMVAVRMEQIEFADRRRYTDSQQSWGKSVEMSATEIMQKLREEGLTPRTAEYKKRLKELRTYGRKAVGEEVNQVGKLNDFTVGTLRKESDPDSEVYYSLDDAKQELLKLQKIPEPDEGQIQQAQMLRERIESANKDQTTELVKDNLEQDLLPRSYTRTVTTSAIKSPTKANLETMRTNVRKIGNRLGVYEIKGKKDRKETQARLEQISRAMVKNKDKVLDRMVTAGKWQNVEDVIRASHALANEENLKRVKAPVNNKPKPETKVEATTSVEQPTPPVRLDEQSLDVLDETIPPEVHGKSPEEVQQIKDAEADAYKKLLEESSKKISENMGNFVRSGEKDAFAKARKPTGALDRVGRLAAKITEDIGSKLQNSKLTSLEYFGSRVTEIGRGYGGNIRRKATGGIIRDGVYKESMMKIMPQYVRIMDDYAAAHGAGAVGKMNAQQKAGADSKIVKQFNRDVFRVQELRRQGRMSEINVHKSVLEFVDQWDKYMDFNHNTLVEAGVGGFTKDRKVKHYIPHIWESAKLKHMMKVHGEDKVYELFRRAYKSAIQSGTNPADVSEANQLANKLVDWIIESDETELDQFLPVKDSRAKQRMDIDTTMEFEGLSIMDILDDEVAGIGMKYSNRMAGWVGLSKSTDGTLTSQMDIELFKKNMIAEAKEKGIDSKKYEQYYDDVINLMFGRPTRGGLTAELRQLKDLTALTRMGGLGTAQLIETGQVITRSALNLSASNAKRVIADNVTASKSEDSLMREIQSISSITDDIEWLDRQSVHLDQAELQKLNKMRQVSLYLADKATFGSLKAPASRLLGKTTGFNAVRRAQSRIAQMSFTVDVMRHFKAGKGVMGNQRMADLGLTEVDGTDSGMSEVVSKYVEFDGDGYPTKLNVDKWPDDVRERFQFAMLRDEAQQVQRTQVGELPPWMNRPLMSLVFQFRQMPIVANNKQLGRNMAFADKEAVTATMLNAAISGMVRYSKFAVLGVGYASLTDSDVQEPNYKMMQTDKYIAQFGIFPDAKDFVMGAYQAGTSDKPLERMKDEVFGQIPAMGLMSDYKETLTNDMGSREQIEAAQGLVPLGNTAYADMVHTWMVDTFGE